jgi:dihydroxyacetone kinase-like protein
MTLGRQLPCEPTAADAARALGLAIEAVKKLGKSDRGQKTLLDVLAPAQAELAAGGEGLRERVRQRAAAAAEATIPMRAIKGRASFLGERSIGHMDPGARSCSLMIAAVCDALEG